jgi:hypothetical protein
MPHPDVLHPLTFVKTAGGGIRGEYFQPQPAFTGRFARVSTA